MSPVKAELLVQASTCLPQLLRQARAIEMEAFCSQSLCLDGAPYTSELKHLPFIDRVRTLIGGQQALEKYIKDELGGDPHCANWWLVACLKLVGIPLREQPRENST